MPNFVNKTSTIFFMLLGLIVGFIVVYCYRQKKLDKTTQKVLTDYTNDNPTSNKKEEPDNSDEDDE